MLVHLYLAFWRPDIRDKLIANGSPVVAMCDFIGNGESVVNDTRLVTCPACRETFLNALPTGDGSKMTWAAYLASPQAAPRVTLADRARQADKADAAWSTKALPPALVNADLAKTEVAAVDAWSSLPPGVRDDVWATKSDPPGWKTR